MGYIRGMTAHPSPRSSLLGLSLLWLWACAPQEPNLPPFRPPEPRQAVVISLRGEAFVYREAAWKELTPGDLLESTDTIRVADRSRVDLQIGRSAVLSLQENTLFRLEEVDWTLERASLGGNLEAGTVIAKVQRLAGGSNVQLRSGSVAAGVRGTEFLLQRTRDQVIAAVSTGELAVRTGETTEPLALPSGTEVAVRLGAAAAARPQPLSDSLREAIARGTQTDFLPLGEETLHLTRFLVRTIPADADILMGDRVMGRGVWGGVIKTGNQLYLKIQKGGYVSRELVVEAREGVNPVYVVELEPLSPEERWDPALPQGPTPEELLRLQEATLAALRSRNQELEAGLRQQTERERELTRRVETLAAESADLNARLNRALQERGQLQSQVQTLTQERDQRARELEAARRDLAASRAQLNNLIEAREAEQRATNEVIRQLRDQLNQRGGN